MALLLASCGHRFAKEGVFTSAGYRFVPQDAASHKLSRGEEAGELVGRIRRGPTVRVQPKRLGNYSRYTLRLFVEGGAGGEAELLGKDKFRFAYVTSKGEVTALRDAPETLPKDWVCLLSMEGNLCLMAWHRRHGGVNHKFHARRTRWNDAVYKVLELDDPRYHNDGFPLKELREEK